VLLDSRKPRAEKDTPSPDALVAEIAARQHGVVTLLQLLACGLSRSAITRRLKSGRLYRIHVGVYAVGHPGLSRQGNELAGVLAAGPGSGLGRRSAGELHRISRFPAPCVEVVSPWQRAPRGVRVYRCRGLGRLDLTSEDGIPVTTVHRTLVDLSDGLTKWQLANVIHEAAFRGRFVEPAVRDAMARANGRRRLAVLDAAIALHRAGSAGTRSGNEDLFLTFDLPEPLVNTHLLGFEVDFVWPDRKVAVEIDGAGHGREPTAKDDARQDGALAAAGFTTLRFTEADVRGRGREVARRTAEALGCRGSCRTSARRAPGRG
jgi:hypothetical protein